MTVDSNENRLEKDKCGSGWSVRILMQSYIIKS